MTTNQTLTDQRSTRRTVASIFFVGALAMSSVLGGSVATAAPAEASTRWVSPIGKHHHKPKSWICSVFNICKTTSHYYCGNPKIAYTRPQPCVYLHTDRY